MVEEKPNMPMDSVLTEDRKKHRAATAALFLVSIIWGAGFIMIELLFKASWTTAQIMAARFSIGTLALIISLGKNIVKITKQEIKGGIIAGAMLFSAFYLQTVGQLESSVSNVAFFTATNVVMVPIFAWVLNKERLHLHTLLFAFLSFIGMIVLSYSGGRITLNPGDLATLACAVLFALHIIYLSRQLHYCDTLRLNIVQIGTAAILSVIVWLFSPPPTESFNFNAGIFPILFMGIITCVCYFLQIRSLRYVKSSTATVILALEAFFGSLFALFLGMDTFSFRLLIGGICIVGASILSSYFSAKLKQEN